VLLVKRSTLQFIEYAKILKLKTSNGKSPPPPKGRGQFGAD